MVFGPIYILIFSIGALLFASSSRIGGRLVLGVSDRSARLYVSIFISLCVLASGLYVILSHDYQIEDKKWGYATVGTVVGYWLKS